MMVTASSYCVAESAKWTTVDLTDSYLRVSVSPVSLILASQCHILLVFAKVVHLHQLQRDRHMSEQYTLRGKPGETLIHIKKKKKIHFF